MSTTMHPVVALLYLYHMLDKEPAEWSSAAFDDQIKRVFPLLGQRDTETDLSLLFSGDVPEFLVVPAGHIDEVPTHEDWEEVYTASSQQKDAWFGMVVAEMQSILVPGIDSLFERYPWNEALYVFSLGIPFPDRPGLKQKIATFLSSQA